MMMRAKRDSEFFAKNCRGRLVCLQISVLMKGRSATDVKSADRLLDIGPSMF